MKESSIHYGKSFTAFDGPDAVAYFRATVIYHGLRLYAKTGMKPNRAYSPSAMLRVAGEITGKSYKRGEYLLAADDLETWAKTMKAALPAIVDEDPKP